MLALVVSSCAVDLKRRAQLVDQLLRHARGGLGPAGAEQQHHELVAAQPRHRVALAQPVHEPVGHTLDDLVAGGEAQGIVDQLEPVEIDQHHGEQLAGATRPLDRLGHAVVEQEPVGQAGQRVVVGEAAQGLLGLLAAGQVAHHQHDHAPLALLGEAGLDLDRHQLAGPAAQGELQRHPPGRSSQALEEAGPGSPPGGSSRSIPAPIAASRG